jgi:hypothetical protein
MRKCRGTVSAGLAAANESHRSHRTRHNTVYNWSYALGVLNCA